MIVKTVHGSDPDSKSSSLLTANLIREFEKRQIERAEKRSTAKNRATVMQRVRRSTASYVRQARSIVALRKMKFYEGMKLPDLIAFRGESCRKTRQKKVDAATFGYESVESDGNSSTFPTERNQVG